MSYANNIQAIAAANRLRNRLGVSEDEVVNPFAAIRDLGGVLAFQQNAGPLGLTVRIGRKIGVQINASFSEHIQRYTAAHELGHIALVHDGVKVDGQDVILGFTRDPDEIAAQLFAGSFLMPQYLLTGTLQRWTLDRAHPTPTEVYHTSRDLLVSYEATVRQLERYGAITPNQRQALLGASIAEIKRRLGTGIAMQDAHHDLWIRQPHPHIDAELRVGDELIVSDCPGEWAVGTPNRVRILLSHPGELRLGALAAGPWRVSQGTSQIAGTIAPAPARESAAYWRLTDPERSST